jgi:serine/threonine protein kinase
MGTPDANSPDRTHTAPAAGTRTMGVGAVPADTATYSPATPAALPTPPHDRTTPFGPPGFDLLGKISEGGMGVVHMARDRAVGRVVALKVLKLNVFDARTARVRFTREVRAMARIEHPNLVPVYQSGEYNGVPYFTMKYMPGGTLGGARSGGPLPPQRAAELLRAIADGVAAMHACGILHRDLKPSNVLLDEHGTPHVADFGLVKWTDEDDHTQTGARNGTPQYMSPEQVAGRSRKLTAACDVWALGVIGYELVCGRRPFEHDDREDLYRAITHDRPADPAEVAPDVPAPLAAVLLACLAKDPLARYPSARELVADLDRFLSGQSVNATSPETVSLPPPPRRRTFLKAAAGVLGLGAAGGLTAAFLLARKDDGTSPPSKTFAERVRERFAAGAAVELIGPTGRPEWSEAVPAESLVERPAVDDTFTLAPNLGSAKPHANGWLDLFAHPLPGPFRFEAEVCYRVIDDADAVYAGVYLGRRLWDAAGGVRWQTAAAVLHKPRRGPVDPEVVGVCVSANPVREDMTPSFYSLPCRPPRFAADSPTTDRWVKLAITLGDGDVLAGECDGWPLKPQAARNGRPRWKGFEAEVAATERQTLRPPEEPPPPVPAFAAEPSLFGPAVGVFVWNATVSVRSARLVPLTPGDPS